MENSQPGPAVSGVVVTTTRVRRLAVAAYLARFKGQSRIHTESDLRGYLDWCESRGLDPLAATRPHIELYLRWLQEGRRYRPSTVSRRMSVVAGFYRTCVIDSVLEHAPAEYVRRPNVPAESPTLGLTHLQFEALLTAAKHSTNSCDLWSSSRFRRPSVAPSNAPSTTGPPARSCSPAAAPGWTGTAPPEGYGGLPMKPG